MSSTGSREAKARIELDKAEKGFVQILKIQAKFLEIKRICKKFYKYRKRYKSNKIKIY